MSDWRNHAACRGLDSDMFFPSGDGSGVDALQVCASCAAREACLDAALEEEADIAPRNIYGIRGGLTANARKRILRTRRDGRHGAYVRAEDDACGTERGYKRHRKRGEPTCQACRAAHVQTVMEYKRSRRERNKNERHLRAVS